MLFIFISLGVISVSSPLYILDAPTDLDIQGSNIIVSVPMENLIEDNVSINKREIIEESGDTNDANKEMFDTAESNNNNLVYRPLFTYRKIQHSRRRITMFNSFAG